MTISIADINKIVMDSVASEFSGVIKALTISHDIRGAYNTTTGAYVTAQATDTGRGMFATDKPVSDVFPEYMIGPNDLLVWAEGLSETPKETWTATLDGNDYAIKRVSNVVGGDGGWWMVVT